MSNRTVPATAEGLPTDPVVILAKRWADARQRETVAEKKLAAARKANNGPPTSFFEAEQNAAYDEAEAARGVMASTRATSLLGAAAQIAEAINRADSLSFGMEDRQDQREARAIHRLLWSALRVIEASVGTPVKDAFGWDLASSNTDPWVPLEDRLAFAGYILRSGEDA